MKCCVCGKVINSPEEISWTLVSRAGNMYFCKDCHKDTPSTEDRIKELEEENKLIKDILYPILQSLREIENISNFELCNLDKSIFKDFYKLEEMIDIRSRDD